MRAKSATHTRLGLTRQLLIFQLTLLAIVLVAVTAISLEQARSNFASGQQRRMLAVAEYSAAVPLLRKALADDSRWQSLTVQTESLRATTGVDQLIVTDVSGRVVASPVDPRLLRTTLSLRPAAQRSNGGWAGPAQLGRDSYVVAQVPVLADDGRFIGTVIAAREFPDLAGLLAGAAPDLLTYLSVAGILGAAGSWWLANRVKRQTLGLEPEQIARLVEHREAMLRGIREGVVAVDSDGVITLVNDSARELLGLPVDAVGRGVDDVGLDAEAIRVLRADSEGARDVALVNAGTLLVVNRTTIHLPRSRPEVVTTLRDRTELVTLQHDLGSSIQATNTLRAQTHEFANRLHTISMLMQLGDTAAAVDYIDAVSRDRLHLDSSVLSRISDPAVAALCIAKASLAAERGATLALTAQSSLPRVDETLSADLVTVIGNLVDNALDAVTRAPVRRVEVEIRGVGGPEQAERRAEGVAEVRVRVRDSGPGVATALAERMFEVGATSKAGDTDGRHGFGLAIVQLVATRRGGRVGYENDEGAVFEAVLPASPGGPAPFVETAAGEALSAGSGDCGVDRA